MPEQRLIYLRQPWLTGLGGLERCCLLAFERPLQPPYKVSLKRKEHDNNRNDGNDATSRNVTEIKREHPLQILQPRGHRIFVRVL